jgi:hypothetical protein
MHLNLFRVRRRGRSDSCNTGTLGISDGSDGGEGRSKGGGEGRSKGGGEGRSKGGGEDRDQWWWGKKSNGRPKGLPRRLAEAAM